MEKFNNLNCKENCSPLNDINNSNFNLDEQKSTKNNNYISYLNRKPIKRKFDYFEDEFDELDKKLDNSNFKVKKVMVKKIIFIQKISIHII